MKTAIAKFFLLSSIAVSFRLGILGRIVYTCVCKGNLLSVSRCTVISLVFREFLWSATVPQWPRGANPPSFRALRCNHRSSAEQLFSCIPCSISLHSTAEGERALWNFTSCSRSPTTREPRVVPDSRSFASTFITARQKQSTFVYKLSSIDTQFFDRDTIF